MLHNYKCELKNYYLNIKDANDIKVVEEVNNKVFDFQFTNLSCYLALLLNLWRKTK